jgi:hypothetical protein
MPVTGRAALRSRDCGTHEFAEPAAATAKKIIVNQNFLRSRS